LGKSTNPVDEFGELTLEFFGGAQPMALDTHPKGFIALFILLLQSEEYIKKPPAWGGF
jgi:hypothetical protein